MSHVIVHALRFMFKDILANICNIFGGIELERFHRAELNDKVTQDH